MRGVDWTDLARVQFIGDQQRGKLLRGIGIPEGIHPIVVVVAEIRGWEGVIDQEATNACRQLLLTNRLGQDKERISPYSRAIDKCADHRIGGQHSSPKNPRV